MYTRRPQGFGSLSKAQHWVLSSKGGSKKVAKGWALLTPEKRAEYQEKARLTRLERYGNTEGKRLDKTQESVDKG